MVPCTTVPFLSSIVTVSLASFIRNLAASASATQSTGRRDRRLTARASPCAQSTLLSMTMTDHSLAQESGLHILPSADEEHACQLDVERTNPQTLSQSGQIARTRNADCQCQVRILD